MFHFSRLSRLSVVCLAAWLVAAAAQTATASDDGQIKWVTDLGKAYQMAAPDARPILMFVTMDGCHYCTKMKRDTYSNARVAKDICESFVPMQVHAGSHAALVQHLRVRSFPTTVLVSTRDAKRPVVVDRITGYVSADELRRHLANITQRSAARLPKGK